MHTVLVVAPVAEEYDPGRQLEQSVEALAGAGAVDRTPSPVKTITIPVVRCPDMAMLPALALVLVVLVAVRKILHGVLISPRYRHHPHR